jgi:hypothetical protein
MDILLHTCLRTGNWTCLQVACKIASRNPHLRHTTLGRTLLDESSQRPIPENTQHSQETDVHDPSGIRTQVPSKWEAVGPSVSQRGHRDRPFWYSAHTKYSMGLSFTVPLCNTSKRLFVGCVQKYEFGMWKTDWGWEFIMHKSVGCKRWMSKRRGPPVSWTGVRW